MDSVGRFSETEIDGKPFHTFTLLSQILNTSFSFSSSSSSSGEATIDFDGEFPPTQPLFFCPSFRRKVDQLKLKENGYSSDDNYDALPFTTPPHMPNIRRSSDQQLQYLLDSDSQDICKLPIVPLFWCNNNKPDDIFKFGACGACWCSKLSADYYFCPTCGEKFHKECVEAPLFIKHPSYPFLSLQLFSRPSSLIDYWNCISCKEFLRHIAYHCPTYKLSMHPVCAMKPIPIVIDHPKRHPHPLIYFPKQNSLACNVCGLIEPLFPTYVCSRCVFVVHQDCIYFPYVIRISRHHHRISFTYSLPSGNFSCGVCRKKVDNNCGAYSCNKCDGYFVHTRCALRKDLWDGEELEGVPEEPEVVVEPFQRISDGIILHFSHGHHLKLETFRDYNEGKFCQACVLPVYEGSFYSCMDQCEFILHETCANASLKKYHPLFPLSLTLEVVTSGYNNNAGHFRCNACLREGCGFVYGCSIYYRSFRLHVRCASVSEPFEYQGHEHPLFLALKPEEEASAICQTCKDDDKYSDFRRKLNCIECDYVICFSCATLPYKAKYKHDEHLLTFWKGKDASDETGWCEVCESKLVYSKEGGFYSCDVCCTTLHIDCLLGEDPYMKPGQTINLVGGCDILRNNNMSRPFCHTCKNRCRHKVVFEGENMTFCSISCAEWLSDSD